MKTWYNDATTQQRILGRNLTAVDAITTGLIKVLGASPKGTLHHLIESLVSVDADDKLSSEERRYLSGLFENLCDACPEIACPVGMFDEEA